MIKAIGSRVDLSSPEEEYNQLVSDLLNHEVVCRMKEFVHHGHTTCFQHCLNVSYYNYVFCRLLSLDARAGARAGLLHDLFLYDWHTRKTPEGERNHAVAHAHTALVNAKRYFELNELESEIIEKHMFPINPALPRHKETVVIIMVDKICGAWEVLDHWGYLTKCAAMRLPFFRRYSEKLLESKSNYPVN